MLIDADREWIKVNRAEITASRAVPVTVVLETTDTDPWTGEENTQRTEQPTECIWRELQTVSRTQLTVVDGVEIEEGDVEAKFGENVTIKTAHFVERDNHRYRVVSVNRAGIGEEYKLVVLLRKVT